MAKLTKNPEKKASLGSSISISSSGETFSDCISTISSTWENGSYQWPTDLTIWPSNMSVLGMATQSDLEQEVDKRLKKSIKIMVVINRSSVESQIKMVMENPDVYDMILDPDDDVTQAYIMKTDL